MTSKASRGTWVFLCANHLGLPVVFPPFDETLCGVATCTGRTVPLKITSISVFRPLPLVSPSPDIVRSVNVRVVAVGAFDAWGKPFQVDYRRGTVLTRGPCRPLASGKHNERGNERGQDDGNNGESFHSK